MKTPACLLALWCSALFASAAARPNILLIYADDQSYKTVGCYPESWPWVKTPNLDRLAQNGIRFRGAYLGSWCMPSRASMLTGRYPHGIESMTMEGVYPGSKYDPQQCPFWPAELRRQGYHTAQIGKWHTGTDAGWARDWDHQIVWNRPLHPDNAGAYYERQLLAINGKEQWVDGYPADNYTQWACDYIRGQNREAAKPWYLWLCYGSVHGPSKPAARHKGVYRDAKVPLPADLFGPRPGKPGYLEKTQAWQRDPDGRPVAGKGGEAFGEARRNTRFEDWVQQVNECVPAIDEGVGRLLEALRETGQLENTLIVYTADQGFAMGEHGCRSKLGPYDANYRSPLIVSMPARFARGKVCPQSASAPDLVATFLSLAGARVPWNIHGRDLSPLLQNPEAAWDYPCFYEHTGQLYGSDVTRAVRERSDKLIHNHFPAYAAVLHGGFKLILYLDGKTPDELYDLKNDPEELRNVAGEVGQRERLALLRNQLQAEFKRTEAGFAGSLQRP